VARSRATCRKRSNLSECGVSACLIGYAEQDQQVQARISTFEQALQELGWTSGRNVQFTYRWERGDAERMRIYAAELIGLAPDVILTATTSALAAARR
jgi:putative ABC transport system substrate-binding protein